MNQAKHLYIHIPFCHRICTYCDFYRKKSNSYQEKKNYIEKIILEIKPLKEKFETIYIGGGTPNFLDDDILDLFLNECKDKLANDYEFTIECNPEFLTLNQASILNKNKVNRVSLGVQTTNENILKLLNRQHKNIDVTNAVRYLNQNNITNISFDFIYNLPLMSLSDLKKDIDFALNNKATHLSFYALEIKEGSTLNKQKYKIDESSENDQFEFLENQLNKSNFKRYEISNWSLNGNFNSKHNIAYWKMNDWKAIGVSAYGYENNRYYKNEGNTENWIKKIEQWSEVETYQNILIMGLRMIEGIDLSIPINLKAYNHFKNKIDDKNIVIENNKLRAKNINLLNDILIEII